MKVLVLVILLCVIVCYTNLGSAEIAESSIALAPSVDLLGNDGIDYLETMYYPSQCDSPPPESLP